MANTEKEKSANELKEEGRAENGTATTEAPAASHDDFDWNLGKRSISVYPEKERQALEKMYENTLQTINENEIVKGTVVGITPTDVILNVHFKSDGLVPLSEFRDMEDLKIGDEVEVYVVEKEDSKGHLVLSRKNAKLMRAWEQIVHAYNTGEVVTGHIISKTKGGLIVNVFGLETFLPGSQIDVKPITDYDSYVGKKMEFKVVKINEAIKNAVVSHKALIESDLESQRMDIISKLDVGQVLEGTVKNITDFGAFIDLGGVDGLLYITDISWGRIGHPSEVLQLNQKINVVVLSFDDEKKRISLGLKQLQPHPWETLDPSITVGSKVSGKVVNIEDYGAFLEITPGVEGLIHVSEVSWSNHPINSKEFFKLGDIHEAVVMTIDREERKMSLSIKRLQPDPWEKITEKYPIGSKHKGVVLNITPYGVFVELEEGIGGMVHISDLSWTKRFNHPSEYVKVGQELEVVVLGIDVEERKMTLGHKQLEEDPWDTFETIFYKGSIHECPVIKREDNGAIVLLPYGLEGFVPKRHLKKENGKLAEVDETLPFKVIEFDRKDKRIVLSHTQYLSDLKKAEKGETEQKEKKAAEKGVKAINKKIEKTTLGDISELAALKDNLEEQEKAQAAKASKTSEGKSKSKKSSKASAKSENAETDSTEKGSSGDNT
ncbi:MAG: 30S ribosomal protein S1 [Chitinophagales bacterium]|nr:MAG: 30S ribosomal protein S1 [Chitinophagales bacterium]